MCIERLWFQNETSWVAATAAALYWRVVGHGARAVDCLRQTLHNAPRHMKDIPLISLANILHRWARGGAKDSITYCSS